MFLGLEACRDICLRILQIALTHSVWPFAKPYCAFHSYFHVCWHFKCVLELFLQPVSIPAAIAEREKSQPQYVSLIGCV